MNGDSHRLRWRAQGVKVEMLPKTSMFFFYFFWFVLSLGAVCSGIFWAFGGGRLLPRSLFGFFFWAGLLPVAGYFLSCLNLAFQDSRKETKADIMACELMDSATPLLSWLHEEAKRPEYQKKTGWLERCFYSCPPPTARIRRLQRWRKRFEKKGRVGKGIFRRRDEGKNV